MTKRFVSYVALGENGRFIRLVASAPEAAFVGVESAITAIAQSVSLRASLLAQQWRAGW